MNLQQRMELEVYPILHAHNVTLDQLRSGDITRPVFRAVQEIHQLGCLFEPCFLDVHFDVAPDRYYQILHQTRYRHAHQL